MRSPGVNLRRTLKTKSLINILLSKRHFKYSYGADVTKMTKSKIFHTLQTAKQEIKQEYTQPYQVDNIMYVLVTYPKTNEDKQNISTKDKKHHTRKNKF